MRFSCATQQLHRVPVWHADNNAQPDWVSEFLKLMQNSFPLAAHKIIGFLYQVTGSSPCGHLAAKIVSNMFWHAALNVPSFSKSASETGASPTLPAAQYCTHEQEVKCFQSTALTNITLNEMAIECKNTYQVNVQARLLHTSEWRWIMASSRHVEKWNCSGEIAQFHASMSVVHSLELK